jgi:hypothetical protein
MLLSFGGSHMNRESVLVALGAMRHSGAFSTLEQPPSDDDANRTPSKIATPKSERERRTIHMRESLISLLTSLNKFYLRSVLTALNLIQVASDDYLVDSAIKDLREDNQTLRIHNEALSDNLERSS